MADSIIGTLAGFLASKKAQTSQATPATSPPTPQSENPAIPSKVAPGAKSPVYEQKYRPSFLRKLGGAIADEALRDTGHIGRTSTSFIRGDHLLNTPATTRAMKSSTPAGVEKVSLSQPGAAPSAAPIGSSMKLKDIESQVVRVDKEVRDWGKYVVGEFAKVRGDIKTVSDVAQQTRAEVDQIKRDIAEETFRKRVSDAKIRNKNGRLMSADQAKSNPSDVHPDQQSAFGAILKELEAWAAGGAIGAGGLVAKRGVTKLLGRKAASVASQEAAKMAEKSAGSLVEKEVAKSAASSMEKKAAESFALRVGKGMVSRKGGLIGTSIDILQAMKNDSQTGNHLRSWLRQKLGIEDPGEAAPWAGAMPNADAEKSIDPPKKEEEKNKPEGDIVIESKKNVSVKAVQDILIEARNELTLKGRVITLDADKITFKGSVEGLPTSGTKTPDSGAQTPGNLSSRDQRYEEYVQKYGKKKADELIAAQEDRWTDPMHWVRKFSPFSGGSDRGTAPPGSGSGMQPSGQSSSKAADAIKQFQGGSGSGAAVDLALQEKGLHERKDREAIKEYLKNGGVNLDPATTAWCAAFVNSTLAQTGMKGTGSMAAGSFQNWGAASDAEHVKKGDVLVNRTYSPRTGMMGSHVGFATGDVQRDEQGRVTSMKMISGNESDMVKESWEKVGDWNVRTATEKEMIRREQAQQSQSGSSRVSGLNRGAFEKTFSGTGLGDKYDQVVAAANKNGLDPALLASVMAHETGRGKVLTGNNPAGLMDPTNNYATKQKFESLDAGIEKAAHNLKKRWDESGGDLSALAKRYAPPGAANDPNGLNSGWLPGVSGFLNKFKGDGNVPQSVQATMGHLKDRANNDAIPAVQGLDDAPQRGVDTPTKSQNIEDRREKDDSMPKRPWYDFWHRDDHFVPKAISAREFSNLTPEDAAQREEARKALGLGGSEEDVKGELERNRGLKTYRERQIELAIAKENQGGVWTPDQKEEGKRIAQADTADYNSKSTSLDDLLSTFKDAQAIQDDRIAKSVPVPNTDTKSGEEITQEVKDSTTGPASRGATTESKSDTGSQGSGSAPGENKRIAAPVHHPESEAPRPGTDGYGDQHQNPDDCSICSLA